MMKENIFTLNKLNIDCAAVAYNYASIKNFVGNKVDCTVTIKADAYGLGSVPIMRLLSKSGCNKFFVSTINEAKELRNSSITDEIYVLSGISAGEEAEFTQAQIVPVLNTKEQFELFNNYCRKKDKNFEAVLNIDTGLNYNGIPVDEAIKLAQQGFFNQKTKLHFIISDLACGSHVDSPYNQKQLEWVRKLQQVFNLPLSLATISSLCLGSEYHFDMIRISTMLYGAEVTPTSFPLRPAIFLSSKIMQIKHAEEDLFIGSLLQKDWPIQAANATLPCLKNISAGVL